MSSYVLIMRDLPVEEIRQPWGNGEKGAGGCSTLTKHPCTFRAVPRKGGRDLPVPGSIQHLVAIVEKTLARDEVWTKCFLGVSATLRSHRSQFDFRCKPEHILQASALRGNVLELRWLSLAFFMNSCLKLLKSSLLQRKQSQGHEVFIV